MVAQYLNLKYALAHHHQSAKQIRQVFPNLKNVPRIEITGSGQIYMVAKRMAKEGLKQKKIDWNIAADTEVSSITWVA